MKKIVLLGPAEAGKTSLRKFFFEGVSAEQLLGNEEPASIGLKFSKYEYIYSFPIEKEGDNPEKIPFDLALVDTAGQELEKWLTVEKNRLFDGSDLILFVFDISWWEDPAQKEYIQDLILYIEDIRVELSPGAKLCILAHKVDLLIQDDVEKARQYKVKIKNDLQDYVFAKKKLLLDFNVTPTSLTKKFRRDTFLNLVNLTTDSFYSLL